MPSASERTRKTKKSKMPVSAEEVRKRVIDIRRLFRDLCLRVVEGGMGFRENPAKTLKAPKKEGHGGRVDSLDPAIVTNLSELDLCYKVMAALMGYAGCRESEAASLTWDRIDFTDKVIRIAPNEVKPNLKNERSLRTIKPFDNLWYWLEKYKQEAGGEGLLITKEDGSSYFDGGTLISLQGMFSRSLAADGLDVPEPALRLRRWRETTMRAKGKTELIEIMGAHSKQLGLTNYTDSDAVARKSEIGKVQA